MNVWIFIIPWIVVGIAVVFVAFWGGPGGARQAYLTRGSRFFQVTMLVIYLGIGIAVPAIILTSRTNAAGAKPTSTTPPRTSRTRSKPSGS